jgi:hypothetical protein
MSQSGKPKTNHTCCAHLRIALLFDSERIGPHLNRSLERERPDCSLSSCRGSVLCVWIR